MAAASAELQCDGMDRPISSFLMPFFILFVFHRITGLTTSHEYPRA